ncbi:unnamed protein product [Lymnaea stagnalis]|uniref:Protein twisted gastrulation n=1 Tax=Lymnaea stagnalis TaxID=6523 RepID=A0AAV2IE62_LYMST
MKPLVKTALFCAVTLASFYVLDACNEAVCAPLVSKCMLIKCCDCDMAIKANCSCCNDCQICLSKLYTECCSCVGLCDKPDPEDDMARSSSVEEISDPIPDLFKVLTDEEDREQRWTTFTYAVDLDKLIMQSGKKPGMEAQQITLGKDDGLGTRTNEFETGQLLGIKNCTVAFFSDCMPMAKCKASCKSMGAAKYRWFHSNGCCECVGNSCFDYGLSEPKCLRCSDSAFADNPDKHHSTKTDKSSDGLHQSVSVVNN